MRSLFTLILIVFSTSVHAVEVKFTTSHIHGLYVFVQTISGEPNRSSLLKNVYLNSSYKNKANDQLLEEFSKLQSELKKIYFKKSDDLEERSSSTDASELFLIQSVLSKDLADFRSRTSGLLNFEQQNHLFEILEKFRNMYDLLVWENNVIQLGQLKNKLEKIGKTVNLNLLFDQAIRFYGSKWPVSEKITISLYPIPYRKEHGNTSAESLGNIESVGVLMTDKDLEGTFGVIFHELCHSIYNQESIEIKNLINRTYQMSSSDYAKYAYENINEALASAFGNGWIPLLLQGKLDNSDWYADRVINLFSKAIYEDVMIYIKKKKTIDEPFIQKSIKVFEKTFPNAPLEFSNILKRALIMTDGNEINYHDIEKSMRDLFHSRALNGSSPLDHAESQESILEMKTLS